MNFLSKLKKPAGPPGGEASNFALIAEIKLKSPIEGNLGIISDAAEIAKQYEEGGADALSVVTEEKLFGGNLKLIQRVKNVCKLPVLCKDFVTVERQLEKIAEAGADAVLLLARLLNDRQLKSFSQTAGKLKMLPVIEADNLEDLKRLIAGKYRVLAVNARNFDDFSVDRERSCRLLKMIPTSTLKLAFSGVLNNQDIKKYLNCGAEGVLIGTALLRPANRSELIKELKNL